MAKADMLELNTGDNFIFLVDVSASMQVADCPGDMPRIEYLKEKTITFAREAAKYDTDGIDVITFGATITPYKGVDAEKAATLIGGFKANEMATHTHLAIQEAWKMHQAGKYEQTVVFVATDGAPSDGNKVRDTIRGIAAEVKDPKEFKISFLTVGQIDAALQAFLTELDDTLDAKHDIVDVKALQDVDFIAAFAGALND